MIKACGECEETGSNHREDHMLLGPDSTIMMAGIPEADDDQKTVRHPAEFYKGSGVMSDCFDVKFEHGNTYWFGWY